MSYVKNRTIRNDFDRIRPEERQLRIKGATFSLVLGPDTPGTGYAAFLALTDKHDSELCYISLSPSEARDLGAALDILAAEQRRVGK